MNLKTRLIIMNFLQFAVWGAYLTSMGSYLASAGYGTIIGWFYSVQGIVSIFMPGIMGIVADRWMQPQRLLALCHLLAGIFMCAAGIYGFDAHAIQVQQLCFDAHAIQMQRPVFNISVLFSLYALSVAFYMPTLALSNSVAFKSLTRAGMDTVREFPPVRVFGTVGFICTMWAVDLLGFQTTSQQFIVSGTLSLLLAVYSLTLPTLSTHHSSLNHKPSSLNHKPSSLNHNLALFFLFSLFLCVNLQVTNSYANPYITSFREIAEYADTFGAQHANILISLSQVSETCCILLIPFFLKRFGIKKVMMLSMLAWMLRFALFGAGDPGSGVWMFILSCIVYGVAFDFFNISGALYVDQNTDEAMRSSAQGLFTIVTNGLGATLGTLVAQVIVNHFVFNPDVTDPLTGWRTFWSIFSAYALLLLILFTLIFHPKENSRAE